MTCGHDGFVCFWKQKGKLIGKLNINNPLPVKWNLDIDYLNISLNKIAQGQKLI